VESNKEHPRRFEIAQNLGRVAHTIQAQSRRPDPWGVKHLFRYLNPGCNAGPDARRCQFRRASNGGAGRFEKLVGLARQIQDRDNSCSSFMSIRWSAREARMSCRKILASSIKLLHCSKTGSLVSGLARF